MKVCILIGLKAAKDIPIQNDKLGRGYVSSFFWHESVPDPGSSCRGWMGVKRLRHQTAFPNTEHELLAIAYHGPRVSPLSLAMLPLMLLNFIRSEKYFQIIQNQCRYLTFKFLLLQKIQKHRPHLVSLSENWREKCCFYFEFCSERSKVYSGGRGLKTNRKLI